MRVWLVLIAGCTLVKSDKLPPCEESNQPAIETRDPSSGECFANSPCDVSCGPCPEIAQIEGPDCAGPCENLDETTCLATSTCHAAYSDGALGNGSGVTFAMCWDTTPLVPVAGADCANLDALGCAAQDNCVTLLVPDDTGMPPTFGGCADEGSV